MHLPIPHSIAGGVHQLSWFVFSCSSSEDFSEDLLGAHESELDRMRGFYADNKEVFKLVEKRETLWRKREEFEVNHSNPLLPPTPSVTSFLLPLFPPSLFPSFL